MTLRKGFYSSFRKENMFPYNTLFFSPSNHGSDMGVAQVQ